MLLDDPEPLPPPPDFPEDAGLDGAQVYDPPPIVSSDEEDNSDTLEDIRDSLNLSGDVNPQPTEAADSDRVLQLHV